MTSVQRHRYGDPQVETMPVLAASVIEIGDLCWYDSTNDCVKRATDYAGATDLITTQTSFKKVFCGVARTAKRSTDPAGFIQVQTAGTFEMPCTTGSGNTPAAASFDLATFLGPAQGADTTHLSNQLLVAVAAATAAIGKPARQTTSALTVYSRISSTVHQPAGGVQTIT
jgi:hypothetical protein